MFEKGGRKEGVLGEVIENKEDIFSWDVEMGWKIKIFEHNECMR